MKSRIVTIIATVAILVFFASFALNTVSRYEGIYYNLFTDRPWEEQKGLVNTYLGYMNGQITEDGLQSSEYFDFNETEQKYISTLKNTLATVNTVVLISAIVAVAALVYLFILEKKAAFKRLLKALLIGGGIMLVIVVAGQIWCANNKEGMMYFINSFAVGGITDIFTAPTCPEIFSVPFFGRIVRGSLTITGILTVVSVLLTWFLHGVANKKDEDEDYLYQ